MKYIDIQNGLELRDRGRKGKGHLHAVVGFSSDGAFMVQTRDGDQIIQLAYYPKDKLEITHFLKTTDEKIKQNGRSLSIPVGQ